MLTFHKEKSDCMICPFSCDGCEYDESGEELLEIAK